MQLEVNGEPHTADDRTTIASLLATLGVTTNHVAVEVNRQLIPRAQHASQELNDGDQLEVVTLVGGG